VEKKENPKTYSERSFKMQKLMKRLHKNQKGFTLVELMVVVVIIGILVAIAIPIYSNVSANAKEKALAATARTLNGSWQMYQADVQTGDWPDGFIAVYDSSTADTIVIDGQTYTLTANVWDAPAAWVD
jgi:prepilin-type N-terminal cleavage/methylation domain-containing protein